MATQKKVETVSGLTKKATKAKSIILADYRGLKHKQLEELRKRLRKEDAEFVVAKNRLLLRALSGSAKTVERLLKEPTAALFTYQDEVSPVKTLMKFFQVAGVGKPKGGLLGEYTLTEADVIRLSLLPSRSMLLGQLVGQLNYPIQGLHNALSWNVRKFVNAMSAIQEKKS